MNSLLSSLGEQLRKALILFIKKAILPSPRERQLSISSPPGRLGYRLHHARRTVASFSSLQKKIFYAFFLAGFVSVVGFLFTISDHFLVEVPTYGGALTEGVIGTPRFINPLLAISDADRDLTALVYSGLMRATPEGTLIPDLAESYKVSDNGLVYTFVLKEGLLWHDGESITSDDVLFTITKVEDPLLKSPKRASWEGVTAEKVDERTVTLTLGQPYSPFLENTASLGILPKHIWEKVGAEQFGFAKFNVDPIGSGPYKVEKIHRDASGIPVYYDLSPFAYGSLGSPFIANVRIRFYANEEELFSAIKNGEIEAVNALTPQKTEEIKKAGDFAVETYRLPRVFGVFFNQNQKTLFTAKPVREALAKSLDRENIISSVLLGYGTALYGPLPPGSLGFVAPEDKNGDGNKNAIEEAKALLAKDGWAFDEKEGVLKKEVKKKSEVLEFTLAIPDTQELRAAAELVKEQWEKLGAKVTLKIFDAGDLNQNVIRPRKYDALFFGEIVGRESDPFAFWHSSQRNDPGLNIALYANISADDLLHRGRTTSSIKERTEIYQKFQEEVVKDTPAVFVYSPDFLYIHPSRIQGITTGTITVPSERFLDIHKWFIKTDKVWRVFASENK